MPTFSNIIELANRFNTQEVCLEYLESLRWKDGIPVCPFCQSRKVARFSNGKTFKCSNRDCRKKFSATVGTIFENTKVPLQKWFIGIYLIAAHRKGISSCQLARDLGVTQKTAWFILHRVREMLANKAPDIFGGIVECDETLVGGKEKNKHKSKRTPGTQGRSTKTKTGILGIVERGGDVYAVPVKQIDGDTVIPIMYSRVEEGAIVCTDEWGAYKALRADYWHTSINHGAGQYVDGFIHTNTIEGYWSLLKRGIIGIYHQVSPKHLHRYCNEFTFRYNRKDIADNLRLDIVVGQSEGVRLKYKELTK